jgi:signal peptidase I
MNSLEEALGGAHAVKCELAGEVLASSGTLRLRVTGWSMLPTMWPGDTLVIESAKGAAISEGDIVLFRCERRFVAHRIVAKRGADEDSTILTRGDATRRPDAPLSGRDLLGKVCFIIRKERRTQPRKALSLSSRVIAAAIRRSETLARFVVGVHGIIQSLLRQNPNHRAVPCQS